MTSIMFQLAKNKDSDRITLEEFKAPPSLPLPLALPSQASCGRVGTSLTPCVCKSSQRGG